LLVRAILTTLVPSDAKGSTLRGAGSAANSTLRFKVELASESYDRYDVAIEREWLPATSMVSA